MKVDLILLLWSKDGDTITTPGAMPPAASQHLPAGIIFTTHLDLTTDQEKCLQAALRGRWRPEFVLTLPGKGIFK